MSKQGALWLIVGPSGVGKDSLIAGAREALADDRRFIFPRREITRPADAGGEDHVAITAAEFTRRRHAGGYALSWNAHGLGYGAPVSIDVALKSGQDIVLNGSRGALDDARRRYVNLRIIEIGVSAEVLRARLEARGRETPLEIESRLARAVALRAGGDDVIHFVNDRPMTESIDAFVALLTGSSA